MSSSKEYDLYLSLLNGWSAGFRVALRRYFALREGSNWRLRFGSTIFAKTNLTDQYISQFNFDIKTETVHAGRFLQRLTASDTQALINALGENPSRLSFGTIDLGIDPVWPNAFTQHINLVSHPRFPGPIRWPYLSVSRGVGLNALQRPEWLNLELFSAPSPFAGLPDLLSFIEVPIETLDPLRESSCEWILTPPVSINSASTIRDDKLQVTIDAPSSEIFGHISLGLRFVKDAVVIHRSFHSSAEFTVSQSGDSFQATIKLDARKAAHVDLFLQFRGQHVERGVAKDVEQSINPRYGLLRAFGSKQDLRVIFERNRNSNFESFIELLLEMLGWSTVHLGQITGLTDAPDILAFSNDNYVLVIECTSGDIDHKGKLLKLKSRREDMQRYAEQKLIPVLGIQATVFTAVSRDETRAHWSQAANFDIGVVGLEQIIDWIQNIEGPPKPAELFSAIQRLVPELPQSQ